MQQLPYQRLVRVRQSLGLAEKALKSARSDVTAFVIEEASLLGKIHEGECIWDFLTDSCSLCGRAAMDIERNRQ